MHKIGKNKFLYTVGVILILFSGCVDTGVQSIPDSIIYYSQLKFTNLVAGAGTATFTLNGQSIGSADFGQEAPGSFMQVQAGNKTLDVGFTSAATQQYKFSADTDYKIRIFLIGTAASNDLMKNNQRYIWQTKDSPNGAALFPPDTGQVDLFNGSPDAELSSIKITGGGLDSTFTFDSPLALGDNTGYMLLKAGSYAFDVTYNDSLHSTFNYDVAAKGRYTAVVYDVTGSVKNAVFVDD